MCTVLFLREVHPRYPLVLAANRDEMFARPARPPERLLERPPAFGGVDEIAGGTWMAVLPGGLVVGLTNHPVGSRPDPSLRSRGALVLDAARAGSPEAAVELLRAVDPRRYNPFNFFVASARGVTVAYGRADARRCELEEVPTGVHVLPNQRLDAPLAKVERARALAPPLATALLPGARALLGDHQQPAVPGPGVPADPRHSDELRCAAAALCIHTPHYGTRSAAVVALAGGGVAEYWHAEGPPCTAAFTDQRPLLGLPVV